MNNTDIINSALNYIDAREIVEPNEDSNEGRITRRYYQIAIDAVLSNSKWKACVKSVYPAKLLEDALFGFSYTYLIDKSILRVVTVYNSDSSIARNHIDYERVGNKLYSSSEDLFIEASTKIAEEDFSPMMTEAVMLKLASMIAPALTGPTSGLREVMMNQYEEIISAGINEIDYEVDHRNIYKSENARRGAYNDI